jgi:hypothetical protein
MAMENIDANTQSTILDQDIEFEYFISKECYEEATQSEPV